MSLIKPFRGIRPEIKYAKQITSPNINYINKYNFNNKNNFLNVLNNPNISSANKMLRNLEKRKRIFQDKTENYYLYRITFNRKNMLGIVGKINLENYDDKKILGHEETFFDRIKKRKQQLIEFNKQISPIYTTYKSNKSSLFKLKKLYKHKPNYSFISKDKCKHELWVIDNKEYKIKVQKYLNKIKKIYICDGHHRIQAMLKSKKKISPMIVAFPDKQVNILDYNRVIKSNLDLKTIKNIILKYFFMKKRQSKTLKKNEINIYLNKSWFVIKPRKKINDLNVNILKKLILDKILTNKNKINYISGIKGEILLEKLVKSKKFNLAFKLCPTNISQVISYADRKRHMPQKSTWFHPKPLDGLILSEVIS